MKIFMELILAFLFISISKVQLCKSKNPNIQEITAPVNHGEGPHYDPVNNALFFVDIAEHRIMRLDLNTQVVTQVELNGPVGFVILTNKPDTVVAARGRDVVEVYWPKPYDNATEATLSVPPKLLTTVDEDKPENRLNDAKADVAGRLWAGTMGPEPTVGNVVPFQGALYRDEPNSNKLDKEISNTTVSNGLIWSKDNKILYFIDSPTRKIVAYDYNLEEGTIENVRDVFDFDKYNLTGVPDGMTIDTDDNLWIACFNGYRIIHVDPREGKLLMSVDLNVQRPTSLMFGGSEYDILFITTSRYGLTAEEQANQPSAGKVLAFHGAGARGRAPSLIQLN